MNYLEQFFFSFIKQPMLVEGNFVVGSAGAVGTVKGSGIVSVTHTGTGEYTILLDSHIKFNRYLQGTSGWIFNGDSNIVSIHIKQNPATFQADLQANHTVHIVCLSATGAPADPSSGHVIGFTMLLRRSMVGYN